MATIRYSGNVDNPDSFSQGDMEHLIRTYNETIDAVLYVVNYTNRTTKAAFEKSVEMRGIEDFSYFTEFPQNKLISGLGFANDVYKQNPHGPFDAFSSFLTTKIRNEISEYEETYAELGRRISKFNWAFQTDMIFAFDKLYSEFRKFKSKYKHTVGLHKMVANLEKNIQITAQVIGLPEIKWFNGSLTSAQAISVREKLSDATTPIYPLHMYHDIMRFESLRDKVQERKRDRSRSSHYECAQQDSIEMAAKNIELSQINVELEKRIQQLEQENAELRAKNEQMTAIKEQFVHQTANVRRGLLSKLAFVSKQNKK